MMLKVGKKLFAEEGISAINIVRLSKVVGRSKSSFYFLFKTRENFILELIEYWGAECTDRIIEEVREMEKPVEQFKKLMVLAYTDYENNKFLMQLRVYAALCYFITSWTKLLLNTWIEEIFMDKIEGFEPAEGIREQLQCNVVMRIHSLNWVSMLLDLSKATGDENMRERAIQTANYVTYYLQPDNRIVVGFQYNQWWYSCHIGVIMYLLDFLEEE